MLNRSSAIFSAAIPATTVSIPQMLPLTSHTSKSLSKNTRLLHCGLYTFSRIASSRRQHSFVLPHTRNYASSAPDIPSTAKLLSSAPFSPEISSKLMNSLTPTDVEIKPDGILYLPEIKYRRILNKSFGPGGWAMVPQGDFIVKDGFVCQQFALYADGRFVSSAWGEQSYDDQKMRFKSLATALEGAKSNGLMRCCKDIGIASELWDPHYIVEWKKQNVVEVWASHRVTGKKQKLYRRKDRPPFEYPWQEDKVVEGAGASAEWLATVDMDNTADSNLEQESELLDDEVTPRAPPQQQRQQFQPQQQRQQQNHQQPKQQRQQIQQQPQRTKPLSQVVQNLEDEDFFGGDDLDNETVLSTAPSRAPQQQTQRKQQTKRVAQENDDLDSDGEPDMFADFNDEVEDMEPELDFDAPAQKRQPAVAIPADEYDSFDNAAPQDGGDAGNDVEINLDEVVHFGKYKGKTWRDIIHDKTFVGYAKWAESKMRPGPVRDRIVRAHQMARELGNE